MSRPSAACVTMPRGFPCQRLVAGSRRQVSDARRPHPGPRGLRGPCPASGCRCVRSRAGRSLRTARSGAAHRQSSRGFFDLLAPAADREAASLSPPREFVAGVTRAVVRERDRDVRDTSAGGLRLAARGLRRVRALAAASAPGSSMSIGRRATARRRRSGASPAAERISIVDGLYRLGLDSTKQFRITNLTVRSRGPHPHDRVGHGVRGVRRPRASTGLVLLGAGRDGVLARRPRARRDRSGSSPATRCCGRRFDAAFVRLQPVATLGPAVEGRAGRGAGRPAQPASRARDLHRGVGQVVRPRSERSEPRSVVAGAAVRRLPRGDPDGTLRHAHLHALGRRVRGHHAVRSQAPTQHRRVCVGSESWRRAAAASTAKTTEATTSRALRRSRRTSIRGASGSTAGCELRARVRSAAIGTLTLRLAESLVRAEHRLARAGPPADPPRRRARTASSSICPGR